jgi:hypothetical protein
MPNITYDLSKIPDLNSSGTVSSSYGKYSAAPAVKAAVNNTPAYTAPAYQPANATVFRPDGTSYRGFIDANGQTWKDAGFKNRIDVYDTSVGPGGAWTLGPDGKGYRAETGRGIINNGNKSYTDAMANYLERLNQGTAARLKQQTDMVNSQKKYVDERLNKDLRSAYVQHMLNQKDLNQNLAAVGITGGASESTALGLASNYNNSVNSLRENAENERYELENRVLDLQNQANIERSQNDLTYRDKLLNNILYNNELELGQHNLDGEIGRENADRQYTYKLQEIEDYEKNASRFHDNYMAEIEKILSDNDPTNDWQADILGRKRNEKVTGDETLVADIMAKYGKLDPTLDFIFNSNPYVAEYFKRQFPGMADDAVKEHLDAYNRGVQGDKEALKSAVLANDEQQWKNDTYDPLTAEALRADINGANFNNDVLNPLKAAGMQLELQGGGAAAKPSMSSTQAKSALNQFLTKYAEGDGYVEGYREGLLNDIMGSELSGANLDLVLSEAGFTPAELKKYGVDLPGFPGG